MKAFFTSFPEEILWIGRETSRAYFLTHICPIKKKLKITAAQNGFGRKEP